MSDHKSDVVLIKEFFELTGSDALKEIKVLSSDDRKQLGEGIRNESLTY